jgi:hypothetical protein
MLTENSAGGIHAKLVSIWFLGLYGETIRRVPFGAQKVEIYNHLPLALVMDVDHNS